MRHLINKLRQFRNLRTTIIGSSSRVFALASQFVFVIILSRLLAKEDFGNFMIVFSIYRLIGTSVGTGIAAVLLYHIARGRSDAEGVGLHRFALLIGIAVGIPCCLAGLFLHEAIAAAFSKPGLSGWLVTMTPFLLATLLSTTSTGAFEGRNDVARAIVFTETSPNFLRLVLLVPLMFLPSSHGLIAAVVALSVALPWLFAAHGVFTDRSGGEPARFSRWDYGYAFKLTLYNFAAYQVQGVDMIVAGSLFTAENVADYAIASRIASLFPFFLQLRIRMLGPVAARLFSDKAIDRLQAEMRAAKYFSVILVMLTVAGLLVAAPLFLTMFWNSSLVAPLLILMAFPPIYRSLFAAGDRLLQVSGHAGWNLGIMLASLFMLVSVPVLLAPHMGILALPAAMILSTLVLNPVIASAVRGKTGIILNDLSDIPVVLATGAALALPYFLLPSAYPIIVSGGILFLLALVYAVLRRREFKAGA